MRLLLSTRKGLITYQRSAQGWRYEGVHFLGIPVTLTHIDRRNGHWWACLDHGHWGCKLHVSRDEGKHWEEVTAPQYPAGLEMKKDTPAALRYLWAFAEGGAAEPDMLYVGTEPGGLFRSKDGGQNFELVESLWQHPSREDHWFGGGRDYAGIHSIVVDPHDAQHLYIGISCAGVFESTDAGENWAVRNQGLRADFLPDPFTEVGHDPHLLLNCPSQPEVMWQQNHCGIFKSTDGAKNWQDVTDREGPAKFGFTIAVADDNPDMAWVVPGISDEIRVAVDQALTVCRTDDGGQSWRDFRQGLPQEACFDIVYRHALDVASQTLVFGTTTGNVFYSNDLGESWELLSHTLPMVYAVHLA
ncbi:MAG: glycosyl hydrolase [Bacteroidota bacterium]